MTQIQNIKINPNKIVAYLGKPAKEFTKDDIVEFIVATGITLVTFMYPASDRKHKK